jgi:uncharacterized protein YecE (DUF72 family)
VGGALPVFLCRASALLPLLSAGNENIVTATAPGNRGESGARLWVGTSGWSYATWRGTVYPTTLPPRRYLECYAQQFATTEINSSFYHLPQPKTCQRWAEQVPPDFIFAVKAPRLLTHTQRLQDGEEPWRRFVQSVRTLGTHLGPILLQFPPSLQREDDRLADFLHMAHDAAADLRLVCEFRHESWFTAEIYQLLERYEVALCLADSGLYPRKGLRTTDFLYCRLHGRGELFASSYSARELASLARQLRRYLAAGVDVYVYFNNTMRGHAVDNARRLEALLQPYTVRRQPPEEEKNAHAR